MGSSHRHHYVPQFYLREFADVQHPGSVWVFGKERPGLFRASIDKIGLEKDYYAYENHAGEIDTDSFEQAFSKIEGKAAAIIAKLLAGGRLEGMDKHRLSYFMGLTFTRVPAFRSRAEEWFRSQQQAKVDEMMSSPVRVAELMRRYEEKTGEPCGMSVDEISKAQNPIVKVLPSFSLQMMGLADVMSDMLFDMTWDFVDAPRGTFFVTSDNPILFGASDPDGKNLRWVGLAHPVCVASFPISPGLALLASWNHKSYGRFEVRPLTVRTINRRTVIAAQRHVFANRGDSGIEKLVRRYASVTPAFERE